MEDVTEERFLQLEHALDTCFLLVCAIFVFCEYSTAASARLISCIVSNFGSKTRKHAGRPQVLRVLQHSSAAQPCRFHHNRSAQDVAPTCCNVAGCGIILCITLWWERFAERVFLGSSPSPCPAPVIAADGSCLLIHLPRTQQQQQ